MNTSLHSVRHNPRYATKRKSVRRAVRMIDFRSQERFVTREVVPGPSFAALVRDFNSLFRAYLKLRKRNANPPGSGRFKCLLTPEEAHRKMLEDLERIYGKGSAF